MYLLPVPSARPQPSARPIPSAHSQPSARPQSTVWIDLSVPHAVDLAGLLMRDVRWPRSMFLVDGHAPACQRTLGVSHFVSQLLLLRRTGADVRLLHPNASLRRCLHLLGLSRLFYVAELSPILAATGPQ